jgi:hypothetical protein
MSVQRQLPVQRKLPLHGRHLGTAAARLRLVQHARRQRRQRPLLRRRQAVAVALQGRRETGLLRPKRGLRRVRLLLRLHRLRR